jgi:hypothetical protein
VSPISTPYCIWLVHYATPVPQVWLNSYESTYENAPGILQDSGLERETRLEPATPCLEGTAPSRATEIIPIA